MPITYAGVLDAQVYNANVTTTGAATADSDEFDILNLEGTALITVDDRASGTAAAAIAIEHAEATGGTFSSIPADALFDPDTGQADTFDALSTAASVQSKGLLLQKLKRFLKVTITGTDIDHNLAIVLTGGKKYTGGIG